MDEQFDVNQADCVVGSGPSGVACAAGLLEHGRHVIMLDAGLQLEPERSRVVQRMGALPPHLWSKSDIAKIQEGMNPGTAGIPQKLLFGSDYPYRDAERELGLESRQVGLQASLALGGLSTVWGSALLPYHERDIGDWPIRLEQLSPHYRAALALTGMSAGRDALESSFPLYHDAPGHLEMSRQARAIWQKLDRHAVQLRQRGIEFGRARVAIQAAQSSAAGCNYCGACMYGCPYGFIFNSASVVAAWRNNPRFAHQTDVIVESVHEREKDVHVRGRRRGTNDPFEISVRRVFLAAGVIPTTAILLRSLQLWSVPGTLMDSQYFLLPAVLTKRIAGVRREALHALSQIFVELLAPEISRHTVHIQLYTFNDLIGRAVRNMFGPLRRPLDFLAHELEGRLVLFQGFVHSNDSSRIGVELQRNADRATLKLTPQINPRARQVVGKVARVLLRNSHRLGAIPVPMLLQFATPGRSFHSGGSFPMRATPGQLETDRLGRPSGLKRVHAVDATVFPSVAATTITLTAMANAHRIATEALAE
jgi:choline dehydrogenase-like flavoprotein